MIISFIYYVALSKFIDRSFPQCNVHTGIQGGCLAFTPFDGYLKLWELSHSILADPICCYGYHHFEIGTRPYSMLTRYKLFFISIWIWLYIDQLMYSWILLSHILQPYRQKKHIFEESATWIKFCDNPQWGASSAGRLLEVIMRSSFRLMASTVLKLCSQSERVGLELLPRLVHLLPQQAVQEWK